MKIPFLCNGIIWGQLLPFTSFCASPQPQPWCPAFKRGAIRHPSAVAEHTMSEEETVSCFTLLEMVFLIMKAVSEKQNLPKRYKSKIKLVIILLFRKKNQPTKNPLPLDVTLPGFYTATYTIHIFFCLSIFLQNWDHINNGS